MQGMKTLNIVTLIVTIIGGLNWGLMGLARLDLVASLFGSQSPASTFIYMLIGLSALYQLFPFSQALSIGEGPAEAHHY
jgi:uncharacterized membrane protein YuzA (DUF378 family)